MQQDFYDGRRHMQRRIHTQAVCCSHLSGMPLTRPYLCQVSDVPQHHLMVSIHHHQHTVREAAAAKRAGACVSKLTAGLCTCNDMQDSLMVRHEPPKMWMPLPNTSAC